MIRAPNFLAAVCSLAIAAAPIAAPAAAQSPEAAADAAPARAATAGGRDIHAEYVDAARVYISALETNIGGEGAGRTDTEQMRLWYTRMRKNI
jgi:hypothetical protein